MNRLTLVHAPTPLVTRERLSEQLGIELWIKRDDATSGAESGNKIRKLEFLLADAVAKKSTVVLTCGGIQSNHARATAIVCAQLGLKCVLFLRVDDLSAALPRSGNVALDRLVGAEIRLVTRAEYADRVNVLDLAAKELASKGETPYVIPEGGSNGLGAFGYVEAMREVRSQIAADERFDFVAHACGSGGTAAGIALGAAKFDVAGTVWVVAVCDDRAYFEAVIARIVAEAQKLDSSLSTCAKVVVDDASRGPGYAVMSEEQLVFLRKVARSSGVILDPVYTGKALFGLAQAVERGDIKRGARVLFVHTGGLPGLLADDSVLEPDA